MLVPYKAEHIPSLPDKCRPVLRYRREEFGFLAAFPNGRVGMFEPSVEPLLKEGSSYDECKPHLVTRLQVPTEFHFSAPLMAWVELTRACNLRCPHCFVEAGAPREVEMPTERILRLLDEWAEMGVFSVVLTGGEPSIHPDFMKIVHHAHRLGFTVAIASNGMPLSENTLEQIPQDDVIISVSLDGIHGAGAATGEDDFEAVTRKLLQIRSFGFNTSIMSTTTHDNLDDLQNFINFAIDNEISLRSVPFVPMGRGKLYTELQNQVGDVEKAARFWVTEEKWERIKDRELGLCSGKVFNFLITMVYTMRRCMSGRGVCYVTSDGTVFPCSNCSGGKILAGGNLLENPSPRSGTTTPGESAASRGRTSSARPARGARSTATSISAPAAAPAAPTPSTESSMVAASPSSSARASCAAKSFSGWRSMSTRASMPSRSRWKRSKPFKSSRR